jgi:site-specific DNA-methyltransferase (adenine-specific)
MGAILEEICIGNCRLILGDCLDILPLLGHVDAVVTDPPYGMQWDADTTRFGGVHRDRKHKGGRNDRPHIMGDETPFDPSLWLTYPQVLLWGANHYSQYLPVGTTLVWIKRYDYAFGSFLSDAELAWMKGNHGVYCFRDLSMNISPQERQHSNQKPVPLMRWCVSKTTGLVLDPFMGSGTTGLACLQLGRPFIGIEVVEDYYRVACARLTAAVQQLSLFSVPAFPHPIQEPLFADKV